MYDPTYNWESDTEYCHLYVTLPTAYTTIVHNLHYLQTLSQPILTSRILRLHPLYSPYQLYQYISYGLGTVK